MSWRNLIWMVIVLALAALAFFLSRRRPPHISHRDPAVDDLAGAIKAYKLIRQQSYSGLEPDSAGRGAIDGMVRQVDEHSVYIPPGKAGPFERRSSGTRVDTGLRITSENGRVIIVGAMPSSPAQEAGLFAPMEILAINQTESAYLTLAAARRMLRPADGRDVTLRLRRSGGRKFTRKLTPARRQTESITGLARDEDGQWCCALDEKAGIYYVRISEFLDRTPGELHDLYRRMNRPGGLVLDLRDNPGGPLPAAVQVADLFLAKGLIVRTVSRRNERHAYYAHADGTYPPTPLVVLINAQTASAAEIVAGALQVHGRAVLVGTETFGKWSVQKTFNLGHGLGKVHLTTGEYFLAEPVTTAPTTQQAATRQASTHPTQPATAPATKRPGVRPAVPVRLTVSEIEQLELLRLQAMVAAPPVIIPVARRRSARLIRAILETDAQLAEALKLLRNLPLPATRPSD